MFSTLAFYKRVFWLSLAEHLSPHDTETSASAWARKSSFLRRAKLSVGRDAIVMSGLNTLVSLTHHISIGDHCVIGSRVRIWSFNRVTIETCTVIGAEVTLLNGGHDIDTFEPDSGPLKIGRGCWIGHGAKIVRPVTIGDNAVVEPGAVITTDVPAGVRIAGVPAKVVGQTHAGERRRLWGARFFSPKTFEIIA